jgi:hypothetical protein
LHRITFPSALTIWLLSGCPEHPARNNQQKNRTSSKDERNKKARGTTLNLAAPYAITRRHRQEPALICAVAGAPGQTYTEHGSSFSLPGSWATFGIGSPAMGLQPVAHLLCQG